MDTLILKVKPEKKDFLLSLLKEFSFIEIEENLTDEDEKSLIAAVLTSEKDLENDKFITQTQLKQEINTWRKR